MALVFLVMGPVLSTIVARARQRELERERLLAAQGVTATATVTRLWHTSDKNATPKVAYRFDSSRGEATGTSSLNSGTWRELRTGDPIAIRYLPDRPVVNRPAEGAPGPAPQWVSYAPLVTLEWAPVCFWIIIRRQSRLLSFGYAAQGIVTGIRRSKKTFVSYEFKLPTGEVMRGRSGVNRRASPKTGDEICVLYNPENPRRNEMYPLDLVKAG